MHIKLLNLLNSEQIYYIIIKYNIILLYLCVYWLDDNKSYAWFENMYFEYTVDDWPFVCFIERKNRKFRILRII